MGTAVAISLLVALVFILGAGIGSIITGLLSNRRKHKETAGIPEVSTKTLAELADTPEEKDSSPSGRCYAVEGRRLDSPMILLVVVTSKELAKVASDQMIESCLGSPTFMVRVVELPNVESVKKVRAGGHFLPDAVKGEVMGMAEKGYPGGTYVSAFVRLENEVMCDMSTIGDPFLSGVNDASQQ